MKYLALIFFIPHVLLASSCCGGGSSSSMIILGDNRQEWSAGLGFRNDLGQTDRTGMASFHGKETVDQQYTLNLQLQRQFTELIQAAVKTSVIHKVMVKQGRREKSHGLGDIDLQISYEFLPEYNYSQYRPRGFLYSKITFPQSKGIYDSTSPIYSDVRGSGLYSFSIGTLFVKKNSQFTLKFGLEGQRFFGKKFKEGNLDDYHKVIFPTGLSYAFDPLPISTGILTTWTYQTSKKLQIQTTTTSSREYFWELSVFANWSLNRQETLGMSYSDSTLLGKNINSPLYRSFALTYTQAIEI
jgi:hypothetical protein